MRSIKKLLWLLPLVALLIASVPFAVSADEGSSSTVADGWSVDSDGAMRYYRDGAYVVGVQEIGGYTFDFASDGTYMGLYDAHTNVGVLDTTQLPAYEEALKALVANGGKVYGYYPFDPKVTYTGKFEDKMATSGVPAGYILTKAEGIFESTYTTDKNGKINGGKLFQTVQRDTKFAIVPRGDNYALHVKASETATTHSYVSGYPSGHVAGETIVLEMDYRLGEGYCANSTIQVIDRNNKDLIAAGNTGSSANIFFTILTINKEGGIYLASDTSKLVALLTEDEYTRVSVAIHPSANTMDVYINGLCVYKGATFVSSNTYTGANFQVDEYRTAQFNGATNLGSLYVDNFAAYQASEPVCTVTAEPRNGVYLEGGVLRNYKNNLITLGVAGVTGTAGDYVFNNDRLKFSTLDGSFQPGGTARVMVNGMVTSTQVVAGNVFRVPDAVAPDNGVFGGWLITDGEKKIVAAPGAVYIMNGDITCEANAMSFSVLEGASIRTGSTENNSLRFMAKIDRASYDALIATGAKIETHMLIVPTEFFEKTYGYHTVEALNKSGYEGMYRDITINSWYTTTDKYNYFVGSTDDISVEDYAKEYSAVAYMNITYANGAENTVYAPFNDDQHTRTVYQVAHAAYNDRTTVEGHAAYGNKIEYNSRNTYSPYSPEKLGAIKVAADKVISLDASGEQVVPAGAFYDAPYTVVTSFNSVTGKNDVAISSKSEDWSVSGALRVLYDGRELNADEYTVDAFCSFSVDVLKYDINGMYTEPDDVQSWLMLDPMVDDYFTGITVDEQYVRPETEVEVLGSFCWWYNTSGVSLNPTNISELGSKDNGKYIAYGSKYSGSYYYYDMSDWQSIGFYAWSDKDGATFQFNFYSDDPNSEGEDYYGSKFTMKQGWNKFLVSKDAFSVSRTPMGWDRITKVVLTNTGWNQTPDTSNIVYLSEFRAYDSKDVATPFSEERLASAAIFADNGFYCGIDGYKVDVSDGDENALVFIKDNVYYLPMASVAAVKGEYGSYYPSEGVLTFRYNGADYTFKAGSKSYTVGSEVRTLTAAPIINGRALFFADVDVMTVFGYTQKYVDSMGMVVLSNTVDILNQKDDFNVIYDLIEGMIYVRPTGDKIVEDLNAYSGGQHPYLMINSDGFDRLRYYLDMDATMQAYVTKLESSYGIGSSRFNAAVNRFGLPDGQRLLSISRDVMNKTISWALLAKLYEKSDPERFAIYAERIWRELEAAANFKDENGYYSWHPQHFLDTGELGYPFGICYDWLYDYWIETDDMVDYDQYGYEGPMTRRQIMEDAMFWMGLSATSALPSDTTGKYVPYNYNLAGSTNNWNGVCNGGLMAAALSIANVDRYADSIKYYLSNTIVGVESGMWVYAPEGGYEEGPGYWSYGTTYLQIFMSCLNSACGTNYGLYNTPGFANSVYFCTYLGSANTTWGFHDGGSGSADTNISAWFAKESNDPNVNAIRRQAIEKGWKGVSMYDIMYFDPHIMTATITLGLDSYYSLDAIMTFRSGWDTTDNVFAGLHGGDNAASHGDLDMGNFVINVNGKFVIMDLGSDEYNMPGYFGVYRWSYYRKRAEGQNTLVMIPSSTNKNDTGWVGKAGIPALKPDDASQKANTVAGTNKPTLDQIGSAVSKVLRYETGTNSALGVVEMHPAFEHMTDGIRGMLFTDNRSTIIVQDEAVMDRDMDIWWFAHTQGNITVSEDGRTAIIEYNGICLYAEIVTDMPESAKFTVMAAESLDPNYTYWDGRNEYYTGDIEKSRTGISKLTVRVDDCDKLRLAVVFKVIESPADAPELGTTYQWVDIKDWTVD